MEFTSAIKDFLKKPNIMVLGTIRRDGSIQMSPIWFEYEKGVFRVSTTRDRAKYKNMERDPRVTFVIYDKDNPYQYIQVHGKASFSEEGRFELIDSLSKRYTGNPVYQGQKGDRIVVSITPESHMQMGFA